MGTRTGGVKTNTRKKNKPPPTQSPLSAREILDLSMSETQLLNQIIELALKCGYKAYHTWNSLHSPYGFPDLVLCKPGKRLLILELKRQKGIVSLAQREWIHALRASGIYSRVIRPSDWLLVERLLTRDDLQDLEYDDVEEAN